MNHPTNRAERRAAAYKRKGKHAGSKRKILHAVRSYCEQRRQEEMQRMVTT